MVRTYNGITVPTLIHSSKIISAFDNVIDEESLDYYRMKGLDDVEPILGYPDIICEDDIGKEFISGQEVTEEHIGDIVWYVTDGHHRSIVANEQGVNLLVELDSSCIVLEGEL